MFDSNALSIDNETKNGFWIQIFKAGNHFYHNIQRVQNLNVSH
jgi:hypothetical protein